MLEATVIRSQGSKRKEQEARTLLNSLATRETEDLSLR